VARERIPSGFPHSLSRGVLVSSASVTAAGLRRAHAGVAAPRGPGQRRPAMRAETLESGAE